MGKQYITSPATGRLILVGGRTYRALVAEGLVERKPLPHELFTAESKEEAISAKKILKQRHNDPNYDVRLSSDGKSVIKSKKRRSHKQIQENYSAASGAVLADIACGKLVIPPDADPETYIQEQMLKKLMGLKIEETPRPKSNKKKKQTYQLEQPTSCDESSDSGYSE